MRGRRQGMTIVELLVVAALLGVVLTILASFFVQQSQVTRRTQARSEVEVNARLAAEILTQDLQVAGSSVIFNAGVANDVPLGCSAASVTKCVSVTSVATADKHTLDVRYATSLRATEPCRRVIYSFSGDTLRRSDVRCDASASPQPIADNITRLNISYQCADEALNSPNLPTDPAVCYAGGSFPRQATVSVRGRSTAFSDVMAEVTLTTAIPNAKF